MSDHEQLADDLEREADRLEQESEELGEQSESALEAAEQAQQDEFTPAPLGEKDPAYRERPEAEGAGDNEPEMDAEALGTPPTDASTE